MIESVQDVCTRALRLTGNMVSPGSTPQPEKLSEILVFLNSMLDHRSIMRNSIYAVRNDTYTLVSGQIQYTIGPSGSADFNATRPTQILKANVIYQTSPELRLPLEIITYDPWGDIRVPTLTAIPLKLYYVGDFTQTAPTGLANIILWPGPDQVYQLELFTPQQLPSSLALVDTLLLPPGYDKCVVYGLADELLQLYPPKNRVESARAARITQIAAESWRWIEAQNAIMLESSIDPAIVSQYNQIGWNWKYSLG